MDKKRHRNHYAEENEEHFANREHKARQREFQEDDLGFDDEEDPELYQAVQKFLR